MEAKRQMHQQQLDEIREEQRKEVSIRFATCVGDSLMLTPRGTGLHAQPSVRTVDFCYMKSSNWPCSSFRRCIFTCVMDVVFVVYLDGHRTLCVVVGGNEGATAKACQGAGNESQAIPTRSRFAAPCGRGKANPQRKSRARYVFSSFGVKIHADDKENVESVVKIWRNAK